MNHERLSVEKCRELLGDDSKKYTDEQVLAMRDVMYGIGESLWIQLLKEVREKRERGAGIRQSDKETVLAQGPTSASDYGPERKPVNTRPSAQKYFRKQEAAEYLGVSVRTITCLMRRRIIPYHKPSYRVCLFRKEDLDAAMGRFRINAIGEDRRGR